MSTEKTATNFARLVTSIVFIALLVVAGFFIYGACNQGNSSDEESQQKFSQKHKVEYWTKYTSIGLTQARLVQLANRGCEAPFGDECGYASSMRWRIFQLMDLGKIPFGVPGVMTPDQIDQLVDMAEERIASQKFVYLKAHGINSPSDLYLLGEVCYQVYTKKGSLLGGNPTDAELKQLLPHGITKVGQCDWKDN